MFSINMASPFFSTEDRDFIKSELDKILDGQLSMGPNVQAFESEFASITGSNFAIAMNSCTSALESGLSVLGARNSEVIVPSQTFIATPMAVHLSGAKPVFSEINEETLCLDFESAISMVTPDTSGIIIVHFAGLITPEIEKFRNFCNQNNLFLIEDSAHSVGAIYNDKKSGTFGDIGCFSFFPSKVITSGEGGMLVTDSPHIAKQVRSLQHRGRDLESDGEVYVKPGRNVRISEFNALIGRVQLSHLKDYLDSRRRLASTVIAEIGENSRIKVIAPNSLEASSFWKIPIMLGEDVNRDSVVNEMRLSGIGVDTTYSPPAHLQPIMMNLYGTRIGQLPITENFMMRHLCLPSHPGITESEILMMTRLLKETVEKNVIKK